MISYDCAWRDNLDFAKNSYYIWRFMIDKRYQRNGYGTAAMKLAIDFVRTFPCGEAGYCWLSYEPHNEVGFEEKPELRGEDEEMPAVLTL